MRNHIEVGSVDCAQLTFVSGDLLSLGPVNSNNLNSVAWLYRVHVKIKGHDCDGMWSLTLRYEFWHLLKFYELFVSELT